jgi:HAD superfamily hydrolase (TIGR01548 family)
VTAPKKRPPTGILIFDVDGVLVDVRGTYWRSALETVRHLTGKRVTYAELHRWKSKPGFNDDWSMVSAWASSMGHPISYDEARAAFEKFYWGSDGEPGNVRNEKLMVTPRQIEKWARLYELNLFTGRTRQEFSFTFERWPATKHFRTIITMDDAKRKPHPEGLQKILGGRRERPFHGHHRSGGTPLSATRREVPRTWRACPFSQRDRSIPEAEID